MPSKRLRAVGGAWELHLHSNLAIPFKICFGLKANPNTNRLNLRRAAGGRRGQAGAPEGRGTRNPRSECSSHGDAVGSQGLSTGSMGIGFPTKAPNPTRDRGGNAAPLL